LLKNPFVAFSKKFFSKSAPKMGGFKNFKKKPLNFGFLPFL